MFVVDGDDGYGVSAQLRFRHHPARVITINVLQPHLMDPNAPCKRPFSHFNYNVPCVLYAD